MYKGMKAALACAGCLTGLSVEAHELRATQLVNGVKQYTVTSYPTVLDFTFTVTNLHPSLPSELLTATDPVLAPQGWSFAPAPPLLLGVGESHTYHFSVPISDYRDCLKRMPGASNTFTVGFDLGSSSDSAEVTCLPDDAFACDETFYLSRGGDAGPTQLSRLDPNSGVLTPIGADWRAYDALGFNAVDGHLYALSSDAHGDTVELLRIGASGVAEVVASEPALRGVRWTAGTVLPDGVYVAYAPSPVGRLVTLDPLGGAVLSDVVMPDGERFYTGDLATDPVSGQVYAFNSRTQRFAVLDTATGAFADAITPLRFDGRPGRDVFVPALFFGMLGQPLFYGDAASHPANYVNLYAGNFVDYEFFTYNTGPNVTAHADGATCPVVRESVPVTRDASYFAGQPDAVELCLDAGPVSLGPVGELLTVAEAMGVLWANPLIASNHDLRSGLEQARVRTSREVLAALCNERLFGTPRPADLGAGLRAASTEEELGELTLRLRAHNASGRRSPVPLGLKLGRPDPGVGLLMAIEPSFK